MSTQPLTKRNTVGGTATRTAASAAIGLAAADPTAQVIQWGIGAIAGNNDWAIPAPIVSALAVGIATAVQAGWRWLNSHAQPAPKTLGSQIHS